MKPVVPIALPPLERDEVVGDVEVGGFERAGPEFGDGTLKALHMAP